MAHPTSTPSAPQHLFAMIPWGPHVDPKQTCELCNKSLEGKFSLVHPMGIGQSHSAHWTCCVERPLRDSRCPLELTCPCGQEVKEGRNLGLLADPDWIIPRLSEKDRMTTLSAAVQSNNREHFPPLIHHLWELATALERHELRKLLAWKCEFFQSPASRNMLYSTPTDKAAFLLRNIVLKAESSPPAGPPSSSRDGEAVQQLSPEQVHLIQTALAYEGIPLSELLRIKQELEGSPTPRTQEIGNLCRFCLLVQTLSKPPIPQIDELLSDHPFSQEERELALLITSFHRESHVEQLGQLLSAMAGSISKATLLQVLQNIVKIQAPIRPLLEQCAREPSFTDLSEEDRMLLILDASYVKNGETPDDQVPNILAVLGANATDSQAQDIAQIMNFIFTIHGVVRESWLIKSLAFQLLTQKATYPTIFALMAHPDRLQDPPTGPIPEPIYNLLVLFYLFHGAHPQAIHLLTHHEGAHNQKIIGLALILSTKHPTINAELIHCLLDRVRTPPPRQVRRQIAELVQEQARHSPKLHTAAQAILDPTIEPAAQLRQRAETSAAVQQEILQASEPRMREAVRRLKGPSYESLAVTAFAQWILDAVEAEIDATAHTPVQHLLSEAVVALISQEHLPAKTVVESLLPRFISQMNQTGRAKCLVAILRNLPKVMDERVIPLIEQAGIFSEQQTENEELCNQLVAYTILSPIDVHCSSEDIQQKRVHWIVTWLRLQPLTNPHTSGHALLFLVQHSKTAQLVAECISRITIPADNDYEDRALISAVLSQNLEMVDTLLQVFGSKISRSCLNKLYTCAQELKLEGISTLILAAKNRFP